MHQPDSSLSTMGHRQMDWILRLTRSDYKWLGRILLKGLRFAWRHKPGPRGSSFEGFSVPAGPFLTQRMHEAGDLLLWVPRGIDSLLIDDLTGGFGYSHNSIDTGEVDLPTGKPVMIEVTLGQPVERKFIGEYKQRAFARIPISKAGVDAEAFVHCVKSELGEPYDSIETLTFGEIDDPAKQMCSSLASNCLPETVRRQIASARRLGLLRGAAVSLHSSPNAQQTKVFVSPNGFAQYFGAPRGEKLLCPDTVVEPRPLDISTLAVIHHHASRAFLILGSASLFASALIILVAFSRPKAK